MIFEEYLSLSFSYMTFVILDNIENRDKRFDNYFDPKPYNYICYRSTSFMDGNFVSKDHSQLKDVLCEFEKIDPNLLEIIHYTNNQFDQNGCSSTNSALHKAVSDGNQRSIDVLLSFMSKISYDSSRNYLSVMPSLIEQLKLFDYLTNLSQQSISMSKKQVLCANSTYNTSIVKLAQSSAIYIDQKYFADKMDDNPNNFHSYPVNVMAIKVGWLINTPQGKEFLKEILRSNNMDIYKIESL